MPVTKQRDDQHHRSAGCWQRSGPSDGTRLSLDAHLREKMTLGHVKSRRRRAHTPTIALGILLAGNISSTMAQDCISLAGSTACPAFDTASVSTDSQVAGLFPFLSTVTDVSSFDSGIANYIAGDFSQLRYQQLIGCSTFSPDNTTDYYARYTTSVLCNAIVQNSIEPCGLSGDAARPLCADSCAEYAQSEQEITASNICGNSGDNALTQIRADFTNCALPANSLTVACIEAVENQPNDCGYSNNLGGLCSYCSASSPNSTDSCCVFSNSTGRCEGVILPVVASGSVTSVTFTITPTGLPTGTSGGSGSNPNSSDDNGGLSRGAVAGIAIGSILGALLLLGAVIAGCLLLRRRRTSSQTTSIFNQPSPSRAQPQMAYYDGSRDIQGSSHLGVVGAGRVARMSALEGSSSSDHDVPFAMGGYVKESDDEDPLADARLAPFSKRPGSASSGSQLGVVMGNMQDTSPSSGNEYTSPESQGQSEQLNFFKDYYSQDEIRPGDLVATLWAYEPRAADEFQLERGDMVKVLGIWDDGWATGVRVRQRADDWRPEGKVQRDSGLSQQPQSDASEEDGEVKAFPLVCVCLPQHWRKTIEGDSTEGSGPGTYPPERGS